LEHVTLIVDDEAKAPAAGKERQSMPPFILFDSPFTQAGDLSFAHPLLDERWLGPEAFCDDGHINLNGAIFKLDHCHHRYRPMMRVHREFSIVIYVCPGPVAGKAKPPGSWEAHHDIDGSGTFRQRWRWDTNGTGRSDGIEDSSLLR
jgi:hypothetical protein